MSACFATRLDCLTIKPPGLLAHDKHVDAEAGLKCDVRAGSVRAPFASPALPAIALADTIG
jgi:hypothetical protein